MSRGVVGRDLVLLEITRIYADSGEAGRDHDGVDAPPLIDLGLYGGRPGPAALLRLSLALHLRDADARDREQPRPDVLRLGRRRSRILSAHRFLVQEAERQRSDERRVGKECVSTSRSRWSPYIHKTMTK